jgi:hypothetical protein
MRVPLVAIRDAKLQAFQSLTTVPTIEAALRGFADAVANEGAGDLHRHPEDFGLFKVGEFDTVTGLVEGVQPVQVASGVEFAGLKLAKES